MVPHIPGETFSRMVFVQKLARNMWYFDIYQYASYIILLYILPLFSLVTLNSCLIGAIRFSRKQHRETTVTGCGRNRPPPDPYYCRYFPVNSQRPQHSNHHEANATFVLIILVLVFIICETPELVYRIITVLTRHVPGLDRTFDLEFQHTFATVTELLMVINSSVNFFIYCAFGRRFRRVMKITFTPTGSNFTHETMQLNQIHR